MSERDRAYMLRALELAERGWGQTAPNPMVGAVLVRDGEVVGEGWHERFGGSHAEVNAIGSAGERARSSHLYVTLEPCAHHGKTPPCAEVIVRAGIGGVTIAAPDPTPEAGGGADVLRRAGIPVAIGLEEDRARELNAAFYHSVRSDRPWVTLKLAVSLDGAIAPAPQEAGSHEQRWLTGQVARVEVHRMRAGADAVAVGIGTVLADDPRLTVRHYAEPRTPPVRVVFDRLARIPFESQLVQTAHGIPTLVIVARENLPGVRRLRESGVGVLTAADLPQALRLLRARGIRSLLVEGGAGIAGALLNDRCVDRLVLVEAPVVLGEGALNAWACVRDRESVLRTLELRERRQLGDDVMTVFSIPPLRV